MNFNNPLRSRRVIAKRVRIAMIIVMVLAILTGAPDTASAVVLGVILAIGFVVIFLMTVFLVMTDME